MLTDERIRELVMCHVGGWLSTFNVLSAVDSRGVLLCIEAAIRAAAAEAVAAEREACAAIAQDEGDRRTRRYSYHAAFAIAAAIRARGEEEQ